jgi:hypothetical protein
LAWQIARVAHQFPGAAPFPDQIDRYYALRFNVGPGATSPIGSGAEIFIGFAPINMIEIHFKVLSTFKPDPAPESSPAREDRAVRRW